MIKLKESEALRVAAFLCRVLPRGEAEAKELEAYIKRLQGGRQ